MQVTAPPVPQGPRIYRNRVRRLGPVAAVIPAALMGALAWWLVHGSGSATRGVPSFALAVLAAPALLVLGVPMSHGTSVYALAIAASAALWVALGAVAALRATRRPVATWRDFWREFAWLAGGVWLGVAAALIATDLILGRALL